MHPRETGEALSKSGNNLPEIEKIQGNNLPEIEKIQGNNR
jgi:hypothetical protein